MKETTLTLPKLWYWATMAKGMATKRIQIFVPKITSWRFISICLSNKNLMFNPRDGFDFFLSDDDDKLCAVLITLDSLLESKMISFSTSHASLEPISVTTPTHLRYVITRLAVFLSNKVSRIFTWSVTN